MNLERVLVEPYGEVTVHQRDDGTLLVDRADDLIGVSTELLGQASNGGGLTTSPDGTLIIAGTVGYLPVRFDSNGRVVVCRKTWTIQDGEATLS